MRSFILRSIKTARTLTATDVLRRVVGVAGIATLSLTLSACVMRGDVNHAETQPAAESSVTDGASGVEDDEAAAEDQEQADSEKAEEEAGQQKSSDADGIDFSSGGACANGEDGFIKGLDLEVTLSGTCGTIEIEGANLKIALENANTVAIRGENNTVSGADWDVVVIQGLNITADAASADTIDVNGKDVKFTSKLSRTVLLSGEGIDVTTGDATSIAVAGVKNKVVADTVSESITVEGSNNDVAWTGGISQETSVKGEANSFTRP
jgi:hypothetical protein